MFFCFVFFSKCVPRGDSFKHFFVFTKVDATGWSLTEEYLLNILVQRNCKILAGNIFMIFHEPSTKTKESSYTSYETFIHLRKCLLTQIISFLLGALSLRGR